jgi:uncharacterized protein (UPF0305 family)
MQELRESVHDQRTLFLKLKQELRAYSVFDLIKVQALLENDCKYLPPKYKKILKEKTCEQIFSNYKAILSSTNVKNQELNIEQYLDFLNSFQNRLDNMIGNDNHQIIVLFYLCAMYNIFITKTPPHPVGTPFPGGFAIEKIGNEYYCPVKDKQQDNKEALCRFCVAKQMDIE